MKKINCYLIGLFMLSPCLLFGQQLNQKTGIFSDNIDVGNVNHSGSALYDADTQQYTLQGSGSNIWFNKDEFQYMFKKIKGDFILTAQVEFVGKGVDPHRKIGWMVRESLKENATHVSATVHGDGLTSMQFRSTKGVEMDEVQVAVQNPNVIRLMREGNFYTMSVAHWGEMFVSESVAHCNIPEEAYVGLFICSHNPDITEKAIFKNVRIEIPVNDSLVPYRDYLGTNLETINVFTGERKIFDQFSNSIQAPNWTLDGTTLIYNSEGLLYNYNIATSKISVLNTGSTSGNNNDHVLSYDGKYLGISSNHSEKDNYQSVIYYLPVMGGEPKRVTEFSPSYLHGWSPDNKYLIYTAERNGDFDIYKIPRNGGKEIRLTTSKGLDDGSEYTPDGRFIYFNSVRTGSMQIWRMKSDGSEQEQVTFDHLNNWFPHVSPDGKWIVFLTFGNDVNPSDHPFYKNVYLRVMSGSGGESKVIAYLYGGQGTINVPSWSPDSKRIAFVSNSGGIN
ncbi:MAG: hypothetical protein WCR12_01275 [Dysgonamonadaceae bacterium]